MLLRLAQFVKRDVLWVASGQLIALVVGLLAIKVYTYLFTAEQYAYIALFMALSSWIWVGLYQPLNQTIFRLYPLANSEQWIGCFFHCLATYEVALVKVVVVFFSMLSLYGLATGLPPEFYLMILLSALMGVIYGCIHGLVSYYLARRMRKPVAFIQSFDGLFRLVGALLVFYGVSQTEQGVAIGVVVGAVFLLLVLLSRNKHIYRYKREVVVPADYKEHKLIFSKYFNGMFMVMILSATVMHLDKWLLADLIGGDSLGVYAVVYTLAMTLTAVMYAFFEMLVFPLIFNEPSQIKRKRKTSAIVLAYVFCLTIVLFFVSRYGVEILNFLASEYVAVNDILFFWLILSCGIINIGKIMMVHGQVVKMPHKYWPAYFVLACLFIAWCVSFVGEGDGLLAAKGYFFGALGYLMVILVINKRMIKEQSVF